MKITPSDYVAAIKSSVDLWYKDGNRAAFDARQTALWTEIERDPQTKAHVLAILRNDTAEMQSC